MAPDDAAPVARLHPSHEVVAASGGALPHGSHGWPVSGGQRPRHAPIPHHDLDALTDEIFMKTFEVNVYGTWWLSKLAVPHLKKSEDGNIVNITSVAGVRQMGSSMAYSMTKAALNQMTKLMAKSCWPVRVNAVAPGLIATPWTADWGQQHEAIKAIAPLKRSGTPEDCAEATFGLLRSRYATGQIFVVDGGLTLVQ